MGDDSTLLSPLQIRLKASTRDALEQMATQRKRKLSEFVRLELERLETKWRKAEAERKG